MAEPGPVLLAGAGGLLGSTFARSALAPRIVPLGRAALDVAQPRALAARIAAARPALVINCAADTDVEGAEADNARAVAVNAVLPELLAHAARRVGAPILHFSSTGCYGEGKRTPWNDADPVRPTTAHHRSKIAGEEAVRAAHPDHLILRLGWLYGCDHAQPKNFLAARLREARGADVIHSDPGQAGSPTDVADVVAQALLLLDHDLRGTMNCVAHGAVSRFEYVGRIVELAGLPTRLRPRRFERRAPVSSNEAAVNTKIAALGLDVMPAWDTALARAVAALAGG